MLRLKHKVGVPRPLFAKLREPATGIVLVAVVVVSACQPLSRPFQPEGKTAALTGYLEPGPRSGLIVTNLGELPDRSLRRVSELLAASLRNRNIAATTNSDNRGRYRLQGRFELEDSPLVAPEDTLSVAIRWKLFDPNGDIAGSVIQEELVSAATWGDFSDVTVMSIVDGAAPIIEHLLDGYGDTPLPLQPLEAVVVYRVDGAPGDGETTLLQGMRRALMMQQIPVVNGITEDTYVVLGAVHIDDGPSNNQQIVQIDWTVIRPDGRRVGSIRQLNSVVAGKLDGAWGAIATAVTYRGANGIISLFKTIGIEWPNSAVNR
jgi:hypothetical protein